MSLFDSVPALLPDASNLHEVFYYIDYGILMDCATKTVLFENQRLYRFDELEANSWYAVRVPVAFGDGHEDRWWTAYWTGEDFVTISRRNLKFVKAPHAGDEVYAIPLRKTFAYRLPQDVIDNAPKQSPDVMRVIQKELVPSRSYEPIFIIPLEPPRTLQYTFMTTVSDVPDDSMHTPNPPVFDYSIYRSVLDSPWPTSAGAPIGETHSISPRTKGYDPDAVGYAKRTDTVCDAPKKLIARQIAKKLARRKLVKQSRKRA